MLLLIQNVVSFWKKTVEEMAQRVWRICSLQLSNAWDGAEDWTDEQSWCQGCVDYIA